MRLLCARSDCAHLLMRTASEIYLIYVEKVKVSCSKNLCKTQYYVVIVGYLLCCYHSPISDVNSTFFNDNFDLTRFETGGRKGSSKIPAEFK